MRRALLSLIVALGLSTGLWCPHAHASGYSVGDSYAAIKQASRRWHVNYWWLVRVATCESGMQPWAYNPSGASGLFQFMSGTYYGYARQIGVGGSPWNPYTAALVAAYMFRMGQSYQWVCR